MAEGGTYVLLFADFRAKGISLQTKPLKSLVYLLGGLPAGHKRFGQGVQLVQIQRAHHQAHSGSMRGRLVHDFLYKDPVVGDGGEQVDDIVAEDGLLGAKLGLQDNNFAGILPERREDLEYPARAVVRLQRDGDRGQDGPHYELDAAHPGGEAEARVSRVRDCLDGVAERSSSGSTFPCNSLESAWRSR